MDDELTQVLTQHQFDPRRLGRNNSGLNEEDISNVICILHPSSMAAFRIVNHTARVNSQHVLQNNGLTKFEDDGILIASELETILVNPSSGEQARDLALRFSSNVFDPSVGFCFGRNSMKCDINLDAEDKQKRVSGTHFRIFYNNSGVLMLEDLSTNGTVLDSVILGGKKRQGNQMVQKAYPQRMLSSGSVIEILSENPDHVIKFILRIPSRDGHLDAFSRKYQAYMAHRAVADERAAAAHKGPPMPDAAARGILAAPFAGPPNPKSIPSMHPPNVSNEYGMHWSGGPNFKCTGVLGKGAFATVYQLATRLDGELYAAKELEKRRFMKNGILDARLDNEMKIMKELRHQNIVQYIDYVETKDHLYIIMEYVQCGDLAGYMQAHGTLPETLAKTMTRQILRALAYLHEKNITHRDIKPDNILICSEEPFVVKLTDFGLSKVVKNNETFLKTFCGTLLYCAPEVFPHYDQYLAGKRPKRRRQGSNHHRGRSSYSQLVDVWSYAAVLWFVLCGKPPFEGVVDANGKGMFNKIMETLLDISSLKEHGVSDQCIDLLLQMLNTDPQNRPDELACFRHPWLAEGSTLPDEESAGGLASIPEDDDEELDASQLSIHDDSPDSANESKHSTGSHDPPIAKRQKGESFFDPRQQANFPSSYGQSYESVPLVTDIYDAHAQHQPARGQKLFGEISQAAFASSGLLGGQGPLDSGVSAGKYSEQVSGPVLDGKSNGNGVDIHDHEHLHQISRESNAFTSHPALDFYRPQLPANSSWRESMVRELNMTSPTSSHGSHGASEKPATPQTRQNLDKSTTNIANPHGDNGQAMQGEQEDVTPKPRVRPTFDRLINIPISASYYYDAYDKTKQNVAWASEYSGIQFLDDGSVAEPATTSLPATEIGSLNSSSRSDNPDENTNGKAVHTAAQGPDKENALGIWANGPGGSAPVPPTTVLQAAPSFTNAATQGTKSIAGNDFLKPPPLLGRLTTTPTSFTAITLPLTQRITTWGRSPGNTCVYRDGHDVRISKTGLEVWFVAPGIQKMVADGVDWTGDKELDVVVATRSRGGIWVNGVRMAERDERGRRCFGRLFTGDEILVVKPDAEGRGGLAFVCEFSVGKGRRRRKGKEQAFVVEHLVEGNEKEKDKVVPTN